MKFKQETMFRSIELDRAMADEEKRTVPASLSSEVPVQRTFGEEVLVHRPGAINLTRAKNGLPLLFSHDKSEFLGRVKDIKLDGDTLRGILHFSDNDKATQVWNDVRTGMLRDMSIGYRINEVEETDNGFRAIDWSLLEASVVAVPADESVGINRSSEDIEMTEETKKTPEGGEAERSGDSVVVDIVEAHKLAATRGEQAGIKTERKRVSDIKEIFAIHEGEEVRSLEDACINSGYTLEQAQRTLLKMLGGQAEPIADAGFIQTEERDQLVIGHRRGQIQHGSTATEKVLDGMGEALLIRAGIATDKQKANIGQNAFTGMTLSEMAREWLRTRNVSMNGWDKVRIVGAAFSRDYTESGFNSTVADFPSLLADVANKSLLRGYSEAPETWRSFCSVGSVSDFKTNSRPNMSMFPDLEVVAENGTFPTKAVTDWAESITASTKGALFSITRQALINDDLASFTKVPMLMGRAAARSIGDDAYRMLLTLQTMGEDSNPLFDATHSNVYGAAAPSVDTVDAIRQGMGTQTDPSGATLNIRPSILVCGLIYEGVASTLRNAQFDPDTADANGNTGGNRPNWVSGTFEVVADARIDVDANSTNWFMLAPPSMFDGIEVAFLNGVESPFLDQQDGFSIDGTQYKVRLDYGVAPLDWRTIALNGTAPI